MPARRVVFDGRYIQDRYHGIGRYAFNLISGLVTLLPDQLFTILRNSTLRDTRFAWTALAKAPNVTFRSIAAPPFGVREQIALPRALGRGVGSIYHTPYFAVPWLTRRPALVTIHDCIFEFDRRFMPNASGYLYYRALTAASLARARVIFVPSAATAADVARFYRIPRLKIVITPEAADESFTPVNERTILDRVRHTYALPDEFILAVGARRPHKNFARLVEAVAGLTDAHLVFVGETDRRFPDTARDAATGLGNRVRFLGHVPEGDLVALYSLATVFACPSLIEGFGLPVLEALACGVPVICSDIPVLREVVGDTAEVVSPADTAAWSGALRRILSDRRLRAARIEAGLARARLFTWRHTAETVLPAYTALGMGVERN